MTRRWWSQAFAPEGSATAEGIVKQLGQPSLDPLTVLVREAAQNSWDARSGTSPVAFDLQIWTLGKRAETWQAHLLPPPDERSGIELEAALTPQSHLLVVSDRNTVGLGGPLRAGRRPGAHERPDFVQFLRNVGEPSDQAFGGGTYGFGKGIFYRLSSAGTILVDTHTATRGPRSRRLIGATLGPSWYLDNDRYTGRHWWGEIADDDIPDPVMDDEAAAAAASLGLRGFADGSAGTDIVILGADLGSTDDGTGGTRRRTAQEAVTFLASSLLWNLWPKFFPDENGQYMTFTVGVDGQLLDLPSPADLDELRPFVEALAEIREGHGTAFTRTVPPKRAGHFAMSLAVAAGGTSRLIATTARPYEGPSHHVARMRVAELVVDYLEGPLHPDPLLSYAGVFRATKDADAHFASAEPPTHDDWVLTGLQGTARGVVLGARHFVLTRVADELGVGSYTDLGGGQGLGELSARLASRVPAISGTGASGLPAASDGRAPVPTGSTPTSSSGEPADPGASASPGAGLAPSTARPRIVGAPVLQLLDGTPRLAARIAIPASDAPRSVRAAAIVVVEGGGRETEAPAGAQTPIVTSWQQVEGAEPQPGDTLVLPAGAACEWWAFATHVADAVVRFRVEKVSRHGS